MKPQTNDPAPRGLRGEVESHQQALNIAALRLLWKRGDTRELRVLGVARGRYRPRTESGYFETPEELREVALREYEKPGVVYGARPP